jgi:hypothetical protein
LATIFALGTLALGAKITSAVAISSTADLPFLPVVIAIL